VSRQTRIAIAVAAILAVVLPIVIVAPTVPGGPVVVPLTNARSDAAPLPLVPKSGGGGHVTAAIPPYIAAVSAKRFEIRFGTYFEKPSARIVLRFLGADGKPGTVCRFAPTAYRDSAPVGCDLKKNEHPSAVSVTASGAAGELAVWGSQTAKGKPSVGRWMEPASGRSLSKRIGFAYGAIDALRPSAFRVPLLVVAIAAAAVLAVFLILSVLAPERDEPEAEAAPDA